MIFYQFLCIFGDILLQFFVDYFLSVFCNIKCASEPFMVMLRQSAFHIFLLSFDFCQKSIEFL